MSEFLYKFRPTNRRLLIVPILSKPKEEKTSILLPEEYSAEENEYIAAVVLDTAPDCADFYKRRRRESPEVIVNRSMIEEVSYKGKKYYVILENYVIGMLESME